jgi:hypothetical protein
MKDINSKGPSTNNVITHCVGTMRESSSTCSRKGSKRDTGISNSDNSIYYKGENRTKKFTYNVADSTLKLKEEKEEMEKLRIQEKNDRIQLDKHIKKVNAVVQWFEEVTKTLELGSGSDSEGETMLVQASSLLPSTSGDPPKLSHYLEIKKESLPAERQAIHKRIDAIRKKHESMSFFVKGITSSDVLRDYLVTYQDWASEAPNLHRDELSFLKVKLAELRKEAQDITTNATTLQKEIEDIRESKAQKIKEQLDNKVKEEKIQTFFKKRDVTIDIGNCDNFIKKLQEDLNRYLECSIAELDQFEESLKQYYEHGLIVETGLSPFEIVSVAIIEISTKEQYKVREEQILQIRTAVDARSVFLGLRMGVLDTSLNTVKKLAGVPNETCNLKVKLEEKYQYALTHKKTRESEKYKKGLEDIKTIESGLSEAIAYTNETTKLEQEKFHLGAGNIKYEIALLKSWKIYCNTLNEIAETLRGLDRKTADLTTEMRKCQESLGIKGQYLEKYQRLINR